MVLCWSNAARTSYGNGIRHIDARLRVVEQASGRLEEFKALGRGLEWLKGVRFDERGHKGERQGPEIE